MSYAAPVIALGELLAGLDAEYVACDPSLRVGGLTADSRTVQPGLAFVALCGSTHDGHDHAGRARSAGAAVVIAQRRVGPGPLVLLPDTTAALPVLAANLHGWPARDLRLVGITGTNGKTTTAHLLGSILAAAGRPHARLGTTGNFVVDREEPADLTTPFPLELQGLFARARGRGATDVVMEVSSHALDQGRVEPLRFSAVALTSFSQDHLDYHRDIHAYLDAKLRLVSHHLAPGGTAVVAVDQNPGAAPFLAAAPRRVRASRGADATAEIVAEHHEITAAGITAQVRTPAGALSLESPLIGLHNLDNALVAVGLALALGVDLEAVARGLRTARGAPGRLERVEVAGVDGPAVFVDYAHTPDAVARAIAALRPTCAGRLRVVLGCGGDRDAGKRPWMGRIAAEAADLLYATSDNPRTEDPEAILDQMLSAVDPSRGAIREVDRHRAIERAVLEASPLDTVLIAGKGHEDYQILGTTKIAFDDRERAAAALLARRPPAG